MYIVPFKNGFLPLKRTAEFLHALHILAKAFSLHERHVSYILKAIDEAIKLVEQCVSVILSSIIFDMIESSAGRAHWLPMIHCIY